MGVKLRSINVGDTVIFLRDVDIDDMSGFGIWHHASAKRGEIGHVVLVRPIHTIDFPTNEITNTFAVSVRLGDNSCVWCQVDDLRAVRGGFEMAVWV